MSKIKVFIEKNESRADYKVFFVNNRSQQKNQQIIEAGQLVKNASQANLTVSIVKNKNKATILIMPKYFPK